MGLTLRALPAPVAQWIEQQPSKLLVVGSIPTGRAIDVEGVRVAELPVAEWRPPK